MAEPEHFAPYGWLVVAALNPRRKDHDMTTSDHPTGDVRLQRLREALDGLWVTEAGTGAPVRLYDVLERLDGSGFTAPDLCPLRQFALRVAALHDDSAGQRLATIDEVVGWAKRAVAVHAEAEASHG